MAIKNLKSGVSGATHQINAYSADVATVACGLIGDIYSYPLGTTGGSVTLNSKGNVAVESKIKHVNIEAAQSIQMKPTNKIIVDTGRRLAAKGDNEAIIEIIDDDHKDWGEFKIKSRNLDLRCNDHGGIALQIAGQDKTGFENKVKFESDRTTLIGGPASYCGEGGKGLEFGTFNNLHTSLYTGDYRFKGDAYVFAVTRGPLETTSSGKIDYPTQSDDFKDIIDNSKGATWYDIIAAAKLCKGAIESGGTIIVVSGSTSGGTTYVAGNGISIVGDSINVQDSILGIVGAVEPLTGISSNVPALKDIKLGGEKGNFQIDVTGKYTWECNAPKSSTTVDDHGVYRIKGDRVLDYISDAFYTDEDKVFYKAAIDTTFADETAAKEGDIAYIPECELTFAIGPGGYTAKEVTAAQREFYEDPNKFVYKGTKNVSIKYGETKPITKKAILEPATLSAEEIEYYEGQVAGAVYDEEGKLVSGWEKTAIWAKNTLWIKNELNINLESDSKIKFAGKKIETVWTYDNASGESVDHKMAEILLSTEALLPDATEVVFEQKISKNGDRSGQDSEIVYAFGNNVADPEKVRNFDEFKANYNSKHTPKSDEELLAMYEAFLAEGPSYEVRVKISDLLKLVDRVADLEARVAELESKVGE